MMSVKYTVLHSHRFGTDIWYIECDGDITCPEEMEAAMLLAGADVELDRGENLEWSRWHGEEWILVSKGAVAEKLKEMEVCDEDD